MSLVSKTQREDWIDIAKALGILLVYLGHAGIPGTKYIYMFHMPFFFIICGYCWNTTKYAEMPFKDFIIKKANAYIIPYFKIAFICLVLFGILLPILKDGINMNLLRLLFKYLFGIVIYSRGTTEWLPNCSPIWFLTSLFCAEVIFYWIMKVNRAYALLWVFMAGLVGYGCSLVGKVFPWNIDDGLAAIPFLYLGSIVRKYKSKLLSSNSIYIYALLSIFAFVMPIEVNFDGNYFSNRILMYLYGFIISSFILSLCYNKITPPHRDIPRIDKQYERRNLLWKIHNCLLKMGRNTIVLFGYNYAIITFVHIQPFVRNTWANAIMEIACGYILILVLERFPKVKKILV